MSSTFVAHWRWANGYSIIMGQRMFDHFLIHYLLTLLQMKQERVAGLFKGVVPVMIRAFPANAVSEELRVNFICGLVVQQVHRLEFSDISGDRFSPKPLPPPQLSKIQSFSTHLCTRVGRSTLRGNCLAQSTQLVNRDPATLGTRTKRS